MDPVVENGITESDVTLWIHYYVGRGQLFDNHVMELLPWLGSDDIFHYRMDILGLKELFRC